MVEEINLSLSGIRPIEAPATAPASVSEVQGPSFREVLSEKVAGLKFSAHAERRMASRNIELSAADMARLQEGVKKARDKGARESLILLDQVAFVVSIPNHTVVTAVDAPSMRGVVFTQIDSAVIA